MAFTRFSAYLPNQVVVLAQIGVDEKSNEMTQAPYRARGKRPACCEGTGCLRPPDRAAM
ncbi:MAG TPA: hypothetical protein VF026_16945 [Ktedonobacteraceae bacterium]